MPDVKMIRGGRRASRQKVPLIKGVLHADDLELKLADQVVDLDDGLGLGLIFLRLEGGFNNGFLFAAKFGFEDLDALSVLVQLT
jgi:hypothetical protein